MNNQIKEEGLTDAYLLGKYDGIKQGRADVIDGVDGIIKFIKDNSFDHRLEYDSFKVIGSSVIIDLLEQLKEQKNG